MAATVMARKTSYNLAFFELRRQKRPWTSCGRCKVAEFLVKVGSAEWIKNLKANGQSKVRLAWRKEWGSGREGVMDWDAVDGTVEAQFQK